MRAADRKNLQGILRWGFIYIIGILAIFSLFRLPYNVNTADLITVIVGLPLIYFLIPSKVKIQTLGMFLLYTSLAGFGLIIGKYGNYFLAFKEFSFGTGEFIHLTMAICSTILCILILRKIKKK